MRALLIDAKYKNYSSKLHVYLNSLHFMQTLFDNVFKNWTNTINKIIFTLRILNSTKKSYYDKINEI